MYYLDNAATTRPLKEVVQIVNQCLTENFANPSSVHPPGVTANRHVEKTRNLLSKVFKVPLQGIIFCGSGTESDNLAIKSAFGKKGDYSGNLITTKIEHAAVGKTAAWLEEKGVEVRYVNIDPSTGQVDLDHLQGLIDGETRLVSIQHVNSETGVILDLEAIGKIIKAENPKALFHSDGVQAFTKIPIDLKKLGLDLYSISGHKFHGIKGAGALILTKKIEIQPLIHGGGQEFGLRSGTENVSAIAALGTATEIAYTNMEKRWQQVEEFSGWLKEQLKRKIPNIRIYEPSNAIPHILSIAIGGFPGEVLLHHLASENIYVSTGSACNATSKRLSSTLQALKFLPDRIKETIRISITAQEIPEDREAFLKTFCDVVQDLKDLV